MKKSEAKSPDAADARKTTKIGVLAPVSIIVFIALTLAGTYYVRKGILERAMVDAMEIGDGASVRDLVNSFPAPLNVRDKEGRGPLHRAAEWGDLALIELLLRKGANINGKDNDWRTPLHAAAECAKKEVVEVLIAKGADINARNNRGQTPLHAARMNWLRGDMERLFANQVFHRADNSDKTALKAAIEKDRAAVAEALRKAGAKEPSNLVFP